MVDEDVDVPEGITISFLTDEGESLPFYNGIGFMLNQADLVRGGFQAYGPEVGPTTIKNRELHPLKDHQRAWYAQVDPEDGSCQYAGEHFDAPIKLCNDPAQCAANPGGVHTCGGLFSFSWGDPDLVWVSCQAAPGGGVQEGLGETGDTQYSEFVDQVVTRFENRASDDEFGSYFDTLTPEQVAMVMVDRSVRGWSYRRQGREFLRENGDEAYYAMVESYADLAYLYKDVDEDLDDAWVRGRFIRQSREYFGGVTPDEFRQWYETLDPADKQLIVNDAEMAPVLQQGPGNLDAPVDWDAVAARNQEALAELCARGADERQTTLTYDDDHILIGDGHPFAAVTAIGRSPTPGDGTITFKTNRIMANEINVAGDARVKGHLEPALATFAASDGWDYVQSPTVTYQ
jgi:hypothetical protein